MKSTALVVAAFALPLVLAAFAVGWTMAGTGTGSQLAPPRAPATPAGEPLARIVREEVPGRDIAELPRPPGSTRLGYRHEKLEGLAETRAEYLTDADPDEVRAFYRRTFARGGWVVADLGFSPEEWYFFVVKDEREATVEIQALRQPVVVEVELTGPDPAPRADGDERGDGYGDDRSPGGSKR